MPMRKTTILAAFLIISIAPVLAEEVEIMPMEAETEEVNQSEVGAGWFTPDSALYGIETAIDNTGMALGLRNAEHVAEKRAAEAEAMIEENNSEAAQTAVEGLESAADRAGEEAPGVERARNRVQTSIDTAPEEAQEGLENALENINVTIPHDTVEPGPPEQSEETGGNETGEKLSESSDQDINGAEDSAENHTNQ